MHSKFSFIVVDNKATCDACHFSKHKK